jgi:hypothetical protein
MLRAGERAIRLRPATGEYGGLFSLDYYGLNWMVDSPEYLW